MFLDDTHILCAARYNIYKKHKLLAYSYWPSSRMFIGPKPICNKQLLCVFFYGHRVCSFLVVSRCRIHASEKYH